MQRGLVFLAHPAREVRITQPLIARIFRHVLQHAQPLPDGLSALRRHLPPFRRDVVPDVILLLLRQRSPVMSCFYFFLFLCWSQIFVIIVVPQNFLSILWAQLIEFSRRRER